MTFFVDLFLGLGRVGDANAADEIASSGLLSLPLIAFCFALADGAKFHLRVGLFFRLSSWRCLSDELILYADARTSSDSFGM